MSVVLRGICFKDNTVENPEAGAGHGGSASLATIGAMAIL